MTAGCCSSPRPSWRSPSSSPTRVHERYLFLAFALGAILAATSPRWRVAYVVLAFASFANLYAVLLIPFYENPGVRDWLGVADEIRSPLGVALVALTHLGVFLWTLTELRPRAAIALDAEALHEADLERAVATGQLVEDRAAETARPPDRPASSSAAMPTPPALRETEPSADGPALTARSRLPFDPAEPALLPDRSRRLHGEGGGRLDRLDLWLLLVIVIATLGLRTFRLAEPYRMHFDEVYHARTATEFLQHWRYGQPHDIYEFTHPHLAKYAIAVGLVAVGNDRVTAQRDLGTEVRDVLVEPRWEDPALPDGRAGDRFFVAGGSRLRAYDLATRRLIATWSVPAPAPRARSDRTPRLVGTGEGTIAVLETSTELDLGRTASGGTTGGAPGSTARRRHWRRSPRWAPRSRGSSSPMTERARRGDPGGRRGLARSGFRRGARPGAHRGRRRPRRRRLGDRLTADPAAVTDRHAAAVALAAITGGDADAYERRLAPPRDSSPAPATVIVLGGFPDDQRDASTRRSPTAGWPGSRSRRSGGGDRRPGQGDVRGAGAGRSSTRLMSARRRPAWRRSWGSTSRASTLPWPTGGSRRPPGEAGERPPARSSTPRSRCPDWSGASCLTIRPGWSRAGADPRRQRRHDLRRRAARDAVFADARLPFEAEAWAIDTDGDRPSIDRQEDPRRPAAGTLGAVDAGSHAFAWRLPGVIAGALMAGLVFLLVRMLFRRREVAVLAGILVLVDGMLFVSRGSP